MASIPTALVTMEEYLSTMYHPDCDFVDGTLEERNLGEAEHSALQMELGHWFLSHRKQWRIRAYSEYRTRVSQTRVRIPDVCLVSLDAPLEKVRVTPAILCIEILSPEDRFSRTSAVMEDYLAMGVQNLWILDPLQRIAYVYTPTGKIRVEGSRLEVPGTRFISTYRRFLPAWIEDVGLWCRARTSKTTALPCEMRLRTNTTLDPELNCLAYLRPVERRAASAAWKPAIPCTPPPGGVEDPHRNTFAAPVL